MRRSVSHFCVLSTELKVTFFRSTRDNMVLVTDVAAGEICALFQPRCCSDLPCYWWEASSGGDPYLSEKENLVSLLFHQLLWAPVLELLLTPPSTTSRRTANMSPRTRPCHGVSFTRHSDPLWQTYYHPCSARWPDHPCWSSCQHWPGGKLRNNQNLIQNLPLLCLMMVERPKPLLC